METIENYKKKYEEAMLRMNKWVEGSEIIDPKEVAEFIFPELKESEDEKMRKGLINTFSVYYKDEPDGEWDGKPVKDIIAWLERQGRESVVTNALIKAGLKTYKDGNKWCILVGDNIQEGICGFGDTVDEALFEFLKELVEKHGEQKQNVTDIISDLENYFATTTKEQQEKDWDEIKNWEEKHFNHDRYNEITPTNKVETKFKAGDWVVNKQNEIARINQVKEDSYGTLRYYIEFTDGNKTDPMPCFADEAFHLWTIQDVKDGDILVASDGSIFIFKENEDGTCEHYIALAKDNETINVNDNLEHFWESVRGVNPATKEQRELLLEKIAYAGYIWDPEKRELKKNEQEQPEHHKGEDYGIDGLYHAARILEKTLGEVEGYQSDDGILEHKCAIEAVNRLYEQKPAWSEEDEETIDEAVEKLEKYAEYVQGGNSKRYILDLASRVESLRPSQKREWSEEDDYILNLVSQFTSKGYKSHPKIPSLEFVQDWLKSIKERYAWKPSKEQIEAFEHFVRSVGESGYASPYDGNTKLLYSLLSIVMKTNETPEKLYTDSNGNNPMLKRYWDSDVEYTRTDAFIEKACDWLERNVDHYTNGFGFADYALKLFLTDFKEYMKGE